MSGEEDVPDFAEIADMLASRIPAPSAARWHAGHLISMDRPGEVLALVRELG